jgi:DNA-binding transcriptional ArsR family regulator
MAGVPGLTETDEYDEIFAALKHPVRRQILLFLEERGEASFTQIQNTVGIEDTGLMSYHLKELAPLVEQSERGKYRLSEVGQAGAELFQRVERERQRSSVAVRNEIDKYLSETILKSVFLLGIFGFTLFVPISFDITLSVQGIMEGFSTFQLCGIFLLSLFVMIAGVALFTIYDRHYFSKGIKTSIVHSTIFAAVIALLSSLTFYSIHSFTEGTLEVAGSLSSGGNIPLQFGVLRALSFIASAPAVAYALSKARRRR